MNEDICSLIIEAKNGDKLALEKIIKNVQVDIYSTLFYLNKNKKDIRDITQDVLIKLTKKLYQLKNPKYFKTWLNQIILNTYYDYLRKHKKQEREYISNLKNEESIFEIPDFASNPQDFILSNELDFVIKTSIGKLPLQYKIPITLREIQGLSYDEISNITNTSLGTVKSRIARAREKIKNDINKYASS